MSLMICYQAFVQTYVHFEVIVVEDGSGYRRKGFVKAIPGRLDLHYYVISNSGGVWRVIMALGSAWQYLLILDSD